MGAASRTRLRQASSISSPGLEDRPSHPSHISSSTATKPERCTTAISDLDGAPSDHTSEHMEIMVKIDDMEFIDLDSDDGELAGSASQHESPAAPTANPPSDMRQLPHDSQGTQTSFSSSSTSALSGPSDLSSPPSTVSSMATTPVDLDGSREPAGQLPPAAPSRPRRPVPRRRYDVRPKVSVPPDSAPQEYAMQCVAAAESSRLNPYALHQDEYLMLRDHISHAQVTTYLNIRNGILRLWVRNPRIAVGRNEAIGCAKDSRWFDVANVCYDWLLRGGYINFGCIEIRTSRKAGGGASSASSAAISEPPKGRKRTVAVIGAGMAGLGCARQLEGLFKQYAKHFRDLGEDVPDVVVLEGRNRVGGRVYSRAFKHQPSHPAPGFEDMRATAEMGGMIITGFDRGNPMNILVRGQLNLSYHALWSETTIYDAYGMPVDSVRDQLVEKLYNDCLDRVSEYKFKLPSAKLIEGNRDQMDEGRDSSAEGHKTIAFVEEMAAAQPHAAPVAEQNIAPSVDLVPVSSDRLTGKAHLEPGTHGTLKASYKARLMGWPLKTDVAGEKDLELDAATQRSSATLGSVMDEAIRQYAGVVDLNEQDYRLLNWHIANLEYSNAINYNQLSLQGWDIDAGNEWEGKHTMVVGGYQAVARGLTGCPTPLNVRPESAVVRITYSGDGSGPATVQCEDGHTVEADFVVNTIPLGVLKHGSVEFQPPLPPWKTEAIGRLGFGVLNKVVLLYREAFWDTSRDIFGVLQNPASRASLDQRDYAARRGRFFQWFNVSNTTGQPCLIGLMAGDAAFETERSCDADLVREATEVLRRVFGPAVPEPLESVVTRWASDKFARGSYSSAGPAMQADDYDVMARPVGNLYFAGEHTAGTHPATVHGAYLSGLRAASEVLAAMLGPIDVPVPLVIPKESSLSLKRKALEARKDPATARLAAYEAEVWDHIRSRIGDRPYRPAKVSANPFLLFGKANSFLARRKCEEGRRPGKGRPTANEVRVMTAKMWKDATPQDRRPFEEQVAAQKKAYTDNLVVFTEKATEWDLAAMQLRAAYEKDRPSLPGPDELAAAQVARAKKVDSYAESDDNDVDRMLG